MIPPVLRRAQFALLRAAQAICAAGVIYALSFLWSVS